MGSAPKTAPLLLQAFAELENLVYLQEGLFVQAALEDLGLRMMRWVPPQSMANALSVMTFQSNTTTLGQKESYTHGYEVFFNLSWLERREFRCCWKPDIFRDAREDRHFLIVRRLICYLHRPSR